MPRFTKRQGTRPINRYRNKNKPKIKIGPSIKRTRQIAKKTVLNMAETKYFNVTKNPAVGTDTKPGSSSTVGGGTGVFVKGFAVGSGLQGGSGSIMTYGYNGTTESNVQPLQMNRVFRGNATDDLKIPYILEGKQARPSSATCEWIIQRRYVDTTSGGQALPYFIRMIRVQPKAQKFQNQNPDPQTDLFLDQWGNPTGVKNTAFEKNSLQTYVLNRRRYNVLQDTKMILSAPSNSSLYDQSAGPGNADTFQCTPAIPGQRKLKTYHKLPKTLYYRADNEDFPIAGSNEFVFFHFTLIGGQSIPNSTEENANHVDIFYKPVSTFKEL